MRILTLLLASAGLAGVSLAGEGPLEGARVTFELPDANARAVRHTDLASRYLLLVYQGVP